MRISATAYAAGLALLLAVLPPALAQDAQGRPISQRRAPLRIEVTPSARL
jgi:hypothetical protein